VKSWKFKWFYISNPKPSTPSDIDHLLMPNINWLARSNGNEMSQVNELMKMQGDLKWRNLDGVGVAINFIIC